MIMKNSKSTMKIIKILLIIKIELGHLKRINQIKYLVRLQIK